MGLFRTLVWFRNLGEEACSHLSFRVSLSPGVGVCLDPFPIKTCLWGLAQDCPCDRKNPDHIDSGPGILSGDDPIRMGQAPYRGEADSHETGQGGRVLLGGEGRTGPAQGTLFEAVLGRNLPKPGFV